MESKPIKKSLAFATLLQIRLRQADLNMSYTPKFVRECMMLTVKSVELIPTIFNRLSGPDELKEAAGFIFWPLDLLAEELERELETGGPTPNFARIHRLAGCLSVKLANVLKITSGEV